MMKKMIVFSALICVFACNNKSDNQAELPDSSASFELDRGSDSILNFRESAAELADQWKVEYNVYTQLWSIHVRDISAGIDKENAPTGALYLGKLNNTAYRKIRKSNRKSPVVYGAVFPQEALTFPDSLRAVKWMSRFIDTQRAREEKIKNGKAG